MENNVQFINDSWRYVKRTVNINNFTISYTSEGGFKSQQEAEEAKIPPISFHTLRHQFATMLIEKGVPFEDVSKLLGHKSVMTTFNIYCGVMDADDDARKAVGVMILCPEED